MKQLPMTPQLSARIKLAVGEDVETEGLAVFECIALNTKALPGKGGSLFEAAKIPVLTLQQMASWLENGGHIPLISDHQLMGEPKGRAFAGELHMAEDGTTAELRVLFYLDSTEDRLIAKLNAGTLDEVSVSFLSTQFLCSDCGWDYFSGEALPENFRERTCANGHTIGEDGVHAQLVGLDKFIELSLVARGAADNPKIVGRSASKLQPTSQQLRLAASGFDIDDLVCEATTGEEIVSTPDFAKLTTDLVDSRVAQGTLQLSNNTLTAQVTQLTEAKDAIEASLTAAQAQVVQLTTDLATAQEPASNQADYDAAIAFLGEVLTKVLTASGAEVPSELPATVAELKADIEKHTSNLTAILPVGGVTLSDTDVKPKLVASAFSNRNLGSK